MNSGVGTPFDRHAFEDLVYEIAGDAPLKQEHVERAGHVWHQIRSLRSNDKDRTIKLVQKTLTELHSKLESLNPTDIHATAERADVSLRIEVLRTMLFGTKLAAIPSYQRFQVMMELANRFADTLTSHPEKSCAPIQVPIDGKIYTAWQLEGHYLLFGSADSMQGVTGFSDTLLDSKYHETLCISAINETAAFFMEDQKVFLVLHVDPKTVVHTQEQDLRSPRFKENTLQERTEWYDAARRMMAISGEIDTAEQALRGILHHQSGFSPQESVPYTDLDTFNRLCILVEEKLKGLPNSVLSQVMLYLQLPDSPELLVQFFDAVDKHQLISKMIPAIEKAADSNALTTILNDIGVKNLTSHGSINTILSEKLTLEELQTVLTACCLGQYKSTLSQEAYDALSEKTVDVLSTLNQLISEEKDASIVQALQSFKEDYLFIHDKARYGMQDKDKKELESILTGYAQASYKLKTDLLRNHVIRELELLPASNAPQELELMIEILRGEADPIEDEATAKKFAKGVLIPGVETDDIRLLLQGKRLQKHTLPVELAAARHLINRPQLKLNDLIRILKPLFSDKDATKDATPYQKLFSSLEERLNHLEKAEMTSSDEYKELLAAKEYLSTMLDPVKLFELLFPATARDLDERLSKLDESDPKFQMLSHARQNVVGKLQSLQKDLENIPASVKGWDSDFGVPMDFPTAPESLRSPQELVGQTSSAVAPEEVLNWNEINLDIEASGGGKAGGVYPTAFVISQKLLANMGSLYELGEIFEYANQHSLPVFIRP